MLLPMGESRQCCVSFRDGEGVEHVAEVTAASLYEAGALALQQFLAQRLEPRGVARRGHAAGRGSRVNLIQREGGGAGGVAQADRGCAARRGAAAENPQ
jgi:hypothetical protein